MKKIIINENWEEEIIEDNSNFFVLIFKQGSNAGYVKAFSPNNEEILNPIFPNIKNPLIIF